MATPLHGSTDAREAISIGLASLSVDDVVAVARDGARIELERDGAYRTRLEAGRRALEAALRGGLPVYGVTTGVGASQGNEVPEADRKLVTQNLLRFHGCGTGRILDAEESAAVVVARIVSLARGYSAVRPIVIERLCELANRRILPCIPEEGSVGASGDLTPLSYVAALLVGEREAIVRGEVCAAADALASASLEPLALEPKESLALMNGTSVMTALACLAVERAERLARWASVLTAMTVRAIAGNPRHFDRAIFELKPHPGTRRAAGWIREDLEPVAGLRPARLQDVYSVRCAPHVIGVLLDALAFARQAVEIELNGVNDNPIVDPDTGAVLHGGNFYGGHVAFAMDGLKSAAAGVADLLDRQMQLLCAPATSGGLPENLTPNGGGNHGFKAMGISTSALTAEALKLTMPAAAFSRSTESHNQDKVSMGTIAARDCRRILELCETVAAIVLLADCQALELRGEPGAGRTRELRERVRREVPPVVADRRQDLDIERVLALYRTGELRIDAPPGIGVATRAAASAARRDASAVRLHETQVELDVPFHHVDALGIVWHGHYPKYFEAAGMVLLRKLTLDGGDLIGERYRLVVIESACRHGYPLRYADRVRVTGWISDYARRLVIRYEIQNLTQGRRAAHGHTTLATLDRDGRLLLETPQEIAERIRG